MGRTKPLTKRKTPAQRAALAAADTAGLNAHGECSDPPRGATLPQSRPLWPHLRCYRPSAVAAGTAPNKTDGSDPLAHLEAINAPPTKPLVPLAPSAFDADVRRRREEMKTWSDDEVWAPQDLLGKPDERLLSDERQRRIAVRNESSAYAAAVERAHDMAARERAE